MMRGPKPKTTPGVREERMRALYLDGASLAAIGKEYGITRERVRQLLTKYYGIRAPDGGCAERARRAKQKLDRKREARAQKSFGCSYREYQIILKHPDRPTKAFWFQKRNAASREIGWELNLWEWWSIWQKSGHWPERGRGRGYQMCRLNDVGPYSADNVYIATGVENTQDYWADVKFCGRVRVLNSRRPPGPATDHTKALLRAATNRYRQTPKYKLRYQLRRQGLPKEQRDAIVAEKFGASA